MKTNYILRLYSCFFYELLIQVAIWFLVTFIAIFLIKINSQDHRYIFQFILWISSGIYFVLSWYFGGQTLSMRAWKIKLDFPKKNKFFLCLLRFLLVNVGLVFFFIFYTNILFGAKQYLHDLIIGSKIIDVRIL